MSMHPLQQILENDPIAHRQENPEVKTESRCWTWIKNAFRASRRYSIVITEVSLLALNTIFLIAKADKDVPQQVGEVTLAGLSTIGILSLHYYGDVVWKSLQDTYYAMKVKNRPIAALAASKVLQTTSSVALTVGNFWAAMQGVTGDEAGQMQSYRRMILWGEISIATGTAITLLSLLATYLTARELKKEREEYDPAFSAAIRFCMDKDTYWHLLERLRELDVDESELERAMEIVRKNINTQLKVTLGSKLILIFVGDALQAVEKAYTPNSLVSAIINCVASTGYAVKIVVEKGSEYRQRGKLDRLKTDGYERLN